MDGNLIEKKDAAIKSVGAVKNANEKKESEKVKLERIYKSLNKTDEDLEAIFLEIESDKKIPNVPLHQEYHDSYWKWKVAVEVDEINQTELRKYMKNMDAGVPEVMVFLRDFKEEMMNKVDKLEKENEELKNEMQQMKAMLPQMMMQVLRNFEKEQRQEEQRQILSKHEKFFSSITPPFNGNKKEVDIVFPEPVEACSITFKPKSWNNAPYLRCEVYVDGVLQSSPLSQRTASSYYDNGDWCKDSTINASNGWLHKSPYNANEWLKLDLQQRKTITGIRVGTKKGDANQYVSNFALEFGN